MGGVEGIGADLMVSAGECAASAVAVGLSVGLLWGLFVIMRRIAVRKAGVLYVSMQSHGERIAESSVPGESSESVIVDGFSVKWADEA